MEKKHIEAVSYGFGDNGNFFRIFHMTYRRGDVLVCMDA